MIHDSILRRKGKKFGDRRQDFLQVKWQSDPGLNLHFIFIAWFLKCWKQNNVDFIV